MKNHAKALVGTFAAGAMALSAVTPATAQDMRRHHDHDGISTGEVIAGALIIGGVAAIASGMGNNNRGWQGGNRWGSPRAAVEQCVGAAERQASRRGWRGRADVTDIRSVRDTRYGWEVRGRIAVNTMNRGWRRGDSNYGRGWNGDYRGWNDNLRGYDSGSFVCRIDRGRIGRVEFNGIRGI